MDELGGALRELAGRVEAPTPVDPAGLWGKGRVRVRRRRVAGASAVAAAAALIAVVLVDVPQPTVAMPAGKPHAPAIPKNIYEPNRFLAGVSEEGPPGQLAVIAQSESREGWFGISATTGVYRHLDLPGRATDTLVALSPDGRRLGYWLGTRDDEIGPVPTGVAVYDTITGIVRRHPIPSEHGIRPGQEPVLVWIDQDSLTVSYGLVSEDPSMSTDHSIYRWDLRTDRFLRLADNERWWSRSVTPDGHQIGLVGDVTADPRSLRVEQLKVDLLPIKPVALLPYGNYDNVSAYGDRIAVTGYEGDGGIQRLRVGVIPKSGIVDLAPAGGDLVITELLGWRAADRVLVAAVEGERYPPDSGAAVEGISEEDRDLGIDYQGEDEPPWSLYEIDLSTDEVIRLGRSTHGQSLYVAHDLVANPMVQGREPPSLLWALRVPIAGSVALLAAVAFVLVRRRRRA